MLNLKAEASPFDGLTALELELLEKVLTSYRYVNLAMLTILGSVALAIAGLVLDSGAAFALGGLGFIGGQLAGIVFGYRTYSGAKPNGSAIAVLLVGFVLGLGALPLLFVASQAANTVCKEHGIPVGFLGPDPESTRQVRRARIAAG